MNLKKLIIAFLLGSIAVCVLSLSFSLAWYVSGANLYVDTVVISLSGSADLKISTEEHGEYVEKLERDDLNKVDAFKPVSTMFKDTWMENKHTDVSFYEYLPQGVVDMDYAPFASIATKGYYSQHLYLKGDFTGNVTIDAENFLLEENYFANKKMAEELVKTDPDHTLEEIIERLGTLKKCMRVAILDPNEETYDFKIIEPFKDKTTLLGGRQDIDKTKFYDIYTHRVTGEKKEIIYGEIENRELAVYDDPAPADILPDGELTSFNAGTLEGVRAFKLEDSLEAGLIIGEEETYSLNPESPDYIEKNFEMRLTAYQPKEFVLLIYMEGWDTDCINQHMGGNFNVDLKFKIAERI